MYCYYCCCCCCVCCRKLNRNEAIHVSSVPFFQWHSLCVTFSLFCFSVLALVSSCPCPPSFLLSLTRHSKLEKKKRSSHRYHFGMATTKNSHAQGEGEDKRGRRRWWRSGTKGIEGRRRAKQLPPSPTFPRKSSKTFWKQKPKEWRLFWGGSSVPDVISIYVIFVPDGVGHRQVSQTKARIPLSSSSGSSPLSLRIFLYKQKHCLLFILILCLSFSLCLSYIFCYI